MYLLLSQFELKNFRLDNTSKLKLYTTNIIIVYTNVKFTKYHSPYLEMVFKIFGRMQCYLDKGMMGFWFGCIKYFIVKFTEVYKRIY